MPMVLRLLVALCPAVLLAQPPAAFEAATVKLTANGRSANGWSYSDIRVPSPGRLEATNSRLDELIRYAYDIKDYQLSGPHWLNDDSVCFDISASAPGASEAEIRAMLQKLLAERFHLQAHRDTRDLPVYRLVVGKRGPKLKPAASGSDQPSIKSSSGVNGGTLSATSVSMGDFASELSRDMNRPVLDQTKLTGRYDISVRYDETGIDSAVQQQLGLRLESAKTPVEMLIVDSIERKPTEN
jgi:uncharacterized protein (TIGR03435 family)